MKNFTTFYSKIEKIVEEKSSTKKEKSKGLLAPDRNMNKKQGKQEDIHERIAEYIAAIREQKKGLLNGD